MHVVNLHLWLPASYHLYFVCLWAGMVNGLEETRESVPSRHVKVVRRIYSTRFPRGSQDLSLLLLNEEQFAGGGGEREREVGRWKEPLCLAPLHLHFSHRLLMDSWVLRLLHAEPLFACCHMLLVYMAVPCWMWFASSILFLVLCWTAAFCLCLRVLIGCGVVWVGGGGGAPWSPKKGLGWVDTAAGLWIPLPYSMFSLL